MKLPSSHLDMINSRILTFYLLVLMSDSRLPLIVVLDSMTEHLVTGFTLFSDPIKCHFFKDNIVPIYLSTPRVKHFDILHMSEVALLMSPDLITLSI